MRRTFALFLLACVLSLVCAFAQKPKDVRLAAKPGASAIPVVAQYLNSAEPDTRAEAVKQLVAIGGKDIIDPLIRATTDADAEVQMRATDGLVNYYMPGYVKQGVASTISRAGNVVRSKFGDSNSQVIDAFVMVRPDVITALGKVASGGVTMDSRANACRALGILRGQPALDSLIEALRTKDNRVMFESLVAIEKIRDASAGPRVAYLVRDLDDRVQSAAIETVGILRAKEALPALRGIIKNPRNKNAERSALAALALMPEVADGAVLTDYLTSKDDHLRASGAEGLGRIADAASRPGLAKLWKEEDKMLPRLAAAFGLVMEGDSETAEDAPLTYLTNTLNSSAYREVAAAYLEEAARNP
ncbi:MAG TPA: HEAT repeat domain-containing protein, partial [Bryobacteraceae bacterium]|nr:HEAT repeat domain-containing protein [Bryobacteraceae bacterium]